MGGNYGGLFAKPTYILGRALGEDVIYDRLGELTLFVHDTVREGSVGFMKILLLTDV